ncbi:MAG: sigma 54-interacting transcriptional regulator [bacterium]
MPIGQIMVKTGVLTNEQLEEALRKQSSQTKDRKKLGEILIQHNVINESDLLDSLSIQIDMTFLPIMRYHQSISSLISEKKCHNIERYIKTMAFFIEVGALISHNPDTTTLLRLIAKKASDIMEAERSSIFLLDKDEKELYSLFALEINGYTIHFDKELGIAGHVLKTGTLLNVEEAYKCPFFNPYIDKETGYRTRNMLCTPLINSSGKSFGVFQVLNKIQGNFTEEDEVLIQIMVSQISVSLENISTWNECALIKESLVRENAHLRREAKKEYIFSEIIGMNDQLISLMETAQHVARFNIPVIIGGESGTGKELLAKSIHYNSSRAEAPFVCVNCSAIPDNLLESELFGYEKGAFTGAESSKIGLFEEADKGTLFLDEIGDMNPLLQVKILRFLQDGEVQKVGSNKTRTLDVRIIVATNRDIETLMREGRFREDLYYRINVINLYLPALRNRKSDIPVLVRHFLKKFGSSLNKDVKGLTPEAHKLLLLYDYPGNIRELENIIKRALVITEGPFITPEDLPENLQSKKDSAQSTMDHIMCDLIVNKNYANFKEMKGKAKRELEETLDKKFIIELLKEYNGNISRAAREAKMNRSLLHQLVLRYKLDPHQFRVREKSVTPY